MSTVTETGEGDMSVGSNGESCDTPVSQRHAYPSLRWQLQSPGSESEALDGDQYVESLQCLTQEIIHMYLLRRSSCVV